MRKIIKKLFASRQTTFGVVANAVAVTQGRPGFQTVDHPMVSRIDRGL